MEIINKTRNGNVPGTDDIYAELIKYRGEELSTKKYINFD